MIINTYTLLLKVRSGKGKGVNRTWDFFRKRILKIVFVDFPGGTVGKNLPANAGTRFDPWFGKITHAMEQQSPCTTTAELALYGLLAATTEACSL